MAHGALWTAMPSRLVFTDMMSASSEDTVTGNIMPTAISDETILTDIILRATTEITGSIEQGEDIATTTDITADLLNRKRSKFSRHQEKVSKARLAAEKGSCRSRVELW